MKSLASIEVVVEWDTDSGNATAILVDDTMLVLSRDVVAPGRFRKALGAAAAKVPQRTAAERDG